MVFQPEGERVPGFAAVGVVVGDESVEPAEEKENLAGAQDIAAGAAELVEEAGAVAQMAERAFEEIPRFDGFGGDWRGLAGKRRLAVTRAFKGGLQLGVLVGDILEEADGLGEPGAAVVVAQENPGGAILPGLLKGEAVGLADEDRSIPHARKSHHSL